MRTSQASATNRFGWQLITPAYVLVLVLLVLPLLFSLYISFHRWDLTVVPSVLHWVGLQNFTSILTSAETWRSLSFTGLYTLLCVAGELLVGIGLALLLHRATVGRGIFVSLLILPMMMAPIVTGLAWRLMLNPEYGPLNAVLGLRGTLWLGDPVLAKISVIAATVWQESPFMMVFLLARLRSLATEPFEAARIDGANSWQTFYHITLPLLMPVIVVAVLIRLIFEFRAFDIIWILTTGGPAGATETLSLINFRMSFQHFSIGPGAALSWVMLLITSIGVIWYVVVARRAQQEAE